MTYRLNGTAAGLNHNRVSIYWVFMEWCRYFCHQTRPESKRYAGSAKPLRLDGGELWESLVKIKSKYTYRHYFKASLDLSS